MKMYMNKTVWEEALDRIRFIFDNEENVMVNSSGGKDSTVVMELALIVAREKNRLPLHVAFLDQESEYQATVDYFRKLEARKEIKLHWFQVPFKLNNSTTLSDDNLWLSCWDESEKEKWIRPHEPNAIIDLSHLSNKEMDFYQAMDLMGEHVFGKGAKFVNLVGIRAQESFRRYILMHKEKPVYKNITWASKYTNNPNAFRAYPIYDWCVSDVWKAISNNKWAYNEMYDKMFKLGVPNNNMRVSSIIHETGIHGLKFLQEAEPRTYDKLVNRIGGINTYNQLYKKDMYTVKKLPSMFVSWLEYREYLLETICSEKSREIFIKAFKNHNTEEEAKKDIKTILLNDICLTKHKNNKANETCNKRVLKKEVISDRAN